jgi:hypothetical protein
MIVWRKKQRASGMRLPCFVELAKTIQAPNYKNTEFCKSPLEIVAAWRDVFPQSPTFHRAARQALGSLVCLGRRCLSRIIRTNGGRHRSGNAEYFLYSQCDWQPPELLRPVFERGLTYSPFENRPLDPAGVLSTRPAVAALPSGLLVDHRSEELRQTVVADLL